MCIVKGFCKDENFKEGFEGIETLDVLGFSGRDFNKKGGFNEKALISLCHQLRPDNSWISAIGTVHTMSIRLICI